MLFKEHRSALENTLERPNSATMDAHSGCLGCHENPAKTIRWFRSLLHHFKKEFCGIEHVFLAVDTSFKNRQPPPAAGGTLHAGDSHRHVTNHKRIRQDDREENRATRGGEEERVRGEVVNADDATRVGVVNPVDDSEEEENKAIGGRIRGDDEE
ncbi:uncharacterized protein G2W53_006978 [Senna tora]|uniref:Uncharacterized protein n=1 Tax=Senna tora TaxID=362788 RepID=A0A835CD27_9FABA|nr:uncharacterized protein G2W53_006978 [Senna tora]